MKEKLNRLWKQYEAAVEHRLVTHQFFVAAVYVFTPLVTGVIATIYILYVLLQLGAVAYFGTFGAAVFYFIYRSLKSSTLKDENEDDNEPPIGV